MAHGFPAKFPAPEPDKIQSRRPVADVDKNSPQYQRLCELVERALSENIRRSQARLKGDGCVMKALYYGDNLQVHRDATESVDLIYLDPPFNSNPTTSA